MDITQYTVPRTWKPNDTYINALEYNQYIAWRIGVSIELGTALWIISPAVAEPSPDLDTLLPEGYITNILTSDTTDSGATRSVMDNESLSGLADRFHEMELE